MLCLARIACRSFWLQIDDSIWGDKSGGQCSVVWCRVTLWDSSQSSTTSRDMRSTNNHLEVRTGPPDNYCRGGYPSQPVNRIWNSWFADNDNHHDVGLNYGDKLSQLNNRNRRWYKWYLSNPTGDTPKNDLCEAKRLPFFQNRRSFINCFRFVAVNGDAGGSRFGCFSHSDSQVTVHCVH